MFLFKEHIAIRIIIHLTQIAYKCVFDSIIGAFKVKVVYDLIYVKTHTFIAVSKIKIKLRYL